MSTRVGLHVLFVEPNVDFRHVFSVLLELIGHTVETARNALDAMARAQESPPDVVVTELWFGDERALELAKQLRLLPSCKETVFVALTSRVQAETQTCALEAGFDYFLAKPATIGHVKALFRCIEDRLHDAGSA